MSILAAQGGLMAGTGAGSTFNSLVTAAAPNIWWKLEETTGTSATDSGSAGITGTLTGGADFTTVGIAAASGMAGLTRGANLEVGNANDIRGTVATPASVGLGGNSSSTWTAVLYLAGGSGSGYLLSRQNDFAFIHNFVASTVEFFAIGYTGTDPRTGSGITLSNSDTTTVHQIAYRYDNGNWSGLLDGAEVFNVSRSFGLPLTHTTMYLGSDGASSFGDRKFYDMQTYARAVSTADLAAMWAARNSA